MARVLHVYKYFRPQFTGEGIFVERLAPFFARLRPDVIHDIAVTATARPATPLTLPGLGEIHYLSPPGAPAGQAAIVKWLAGQGGRYAAVHYHTHVDRTFLASLLLKLRGCRTLLSATLDDSVPGLLGTYRPLFRPLVRRLFALIDMFIAISPRLFEENGRFVPARKSRLIPIGIEIPQPDAGARARCREGFSIPPEKTVLVSVGGLCARKDQMFLLHQFAVLREHFPDILLLLVGPPLEADYVAGLHAFVERHGLQDNVRFTGYAETPWDYYKAADMMVFASREEGFGTVVIEAMAQGLPVLVRRLPGVNDGFVENGKSGFLFDTEAQFLAGAATLLGDADSRRRMGEAGRAFVAAHFNIADVARRYLGLYGFAMGGEDA
jgi:glycosyltransferase involved in cell wall biosynthesis